MTKNLRWNIMVIDNSPEAITQLTELFTNKPYDMVTTHDHEEGFKLLIEQPNFYSAIILGKEISNNSNLQLLHKINSSSNIKTIPVIMEASAGSVDEMEKCIRAGARYYISPPINKSIIPQIIATAIRDQTRYIKAEQDVLESKPIGNTLLSALFQLQHLSEGQLIASLIAGECPNPRLAVVGITEMLINAIEHGNLGITYAEKTKLHEQDQWLNEINRRSSLPENINKIVTVKFEKTASHINIRITDVGKGFNWREYQTLNTKRVFDNHGRGIVMARSLAFESLIYHGNGNDVECIIPLSLDK